MNPKKKNWIFIFIVVIVMTAFVNIRDDIEMPIKNDNSLWQMYDANIKRIKENMGAITEPNENFTWWKLKDFDIDDDDYERTLNFLVSDMRSCYLEFTDDGTLYTNSNDIVNYRYEKSISQKELTSLRYNTKYEWCPQYFDRYSSIKLSNSADLTSKVLDKINPLIDLKWTYEVESASYEDMLERKVRETTLLKDLSDYLKTEYERLK